MNEEKTCQLSFLMQIINKESKQITYISVRKTKNDHQSLKTFSSEIYNRSKPLDLNIKSRPINSLKLSNY